MKNNKSKTKDKKYKELNDLSTTKPDQLSQNHQIELGSQGIFSQKNIQKEKENLVDTESKHYNNLTSSSSLSPRQYIIKTDNFEIWTSSTTKCISYHGLPYYSINNPQNDHSNFYIFLNKQGQYKLKENQHDEFKLDSFINKINSLIDSDKLVQLIKKYGLIKLLTIIIYISVFTYLSIFTFYFFYSIILLILSIPPSFSTTNISIVIIFIVNIIILIILLQVSKLLDEKKVCLTFRHLQIRKTNLLNEINDWNLKTFSLINMKADLAENFEYIHIKYQVETNYQSNIHN